MLVVFAATCFSSNASAATVEATALSAAPAPAEVDSAQRVIFILSDGTVIIVDGDTVIIIP